jgi:serine/threonine protein kinase
MKQKRETSGNQFVQYFTEQEFWFYLKQIMAGLMCLREKGIFHGDVQPHNILIMEDNSLKLFDPKYFLDSKSAYTRKLADYEYSAPLCPKLVDA